MLKEYLECGKIVAVHGIAGELRLQPWCDVNDLKKIKKVYLDDKGQQEISLISARPHKNIVILKLEGIDTIEKATYFRNKIIYLNRNSIKLNPGQHFIQDLIGITVIDADTKEVYGKISDVFNNGANFIYSITFSDKSEKLIPAIKSVVIKTDIENEEMYIRPIPGLFDDEEEIR